jgi:hypothetical protein
LETSGGSSIDSCAKSTFRTVSIVEDLSFSDRALISCTASLETLEILGNSVFIFVFYCLTKGIVADANGVLGISGITCQALGTVFISLTGK